ADIGLTRGKKSERCHLPACRDKRQFPQTVRARPRRTGRNQNRLCPRVCAEQSLGFRHRRDGPFPRERPENRRKSANGPRAEPRRFPTGPCRARAAHWRLARWGSRNGAPPSSVGQVASQGIFVGWVTCPTLTYFPYSSASSASAGFFFRF